MGSVKIHFQALGKMTHRLLGRFDEAEARLGGQNLARSMSDGAVVLALDIASKHAAAQGQTLGNIRTRAAAVLSSAAVAVTFATSVGLLANDPEHGGGGFRLRTVVASLLLALVLAIGVLTSYVQWPFDWDSDSGTDVFAGQDRPVIDVQREALAILELAVAKNRWRLNRLLLAFQVSVMLLGGEAALVVIGVIFHK